MILKNVRVAYPHLFEPYAYQNGPNKKYEITIMIPKTETALLDEIKKAIASARSKKWPGEAPKGLMSPVKDGDEMSSDSFKDHFILRAKATPRGENGNRPGVVLPNLKPAGPDDIQSGDFCNVDVNPYGYDQSGNKGIAFGLNNVQLVQKGDRIGTGKARPENVFEAMELAGSPSTGESSDDDFF
jgi:hypothetical protein